MGEITETKSPDVAACGPTGADAPAQRKSSAASALLATRK